MIYPWQQKAWQKLVRNWDSQPNAWLFYGRKNTGNLEFVKEYAQAILCRGLEPGSYLPCQKCQSCHLFVQNGHPDFYHVFPEQEEVRKTDIIRIDSIRNVAEKIQMSSHLGGWKVILIEPAEAMNIQASNALLKVLEEPPQKTIFLLLSYAKDKLMVTVVSRCRQFSLPVPKKSETVAFLLSVFPQLEDIDSKLAFNSDVPFFDENFPVDLYQQFLQLMINPRLLLCLDFAQQYDSQFKSMEYLMDWIYKWVVDLIFLKQIGEVKFNISFKDEIQMMSPKYTNKQLFKFLHLIQDRIRIKNHPLNIKLQIEAILLEYLLISNC